MINVDFPKLKGANVLPCDISKEMAARAMLEKDMGRDSARRGSNATGSARTFHAPKGNTLASPSGRALRSTGGELLMSPQGKVLTSMSSSLLLES